MYMYESEESIQTRIGRRIREQRRLIPLTLNEMARKIGVSYQQLQKYEKGTNSISSARLVRISKILRIPITAFVFNEDDLITEQLTSKGRQESRRLLLLYKQLNKNQREIFLFIGKSMVKGTILTARKGVAVEDETH